MNDMKHKGGVSLVPNDDESGRKAWDEWHIPARDAKGHHVNQQCKVPPSTRAMLQQVIESKAYPYRGVGYLIRHAIMRHLNWLREHEEYADGVGSTIHAINAMTEVVREDEYMEDFRMVFDRLDDRVRDHMQRGNEGRAAQLVIKTWAQVKLMEDPFWAKEYGKELTKRYGNFLKSIKGQKGEGE